METPSRALAPSFFFSGVPSSSISNWSRPAWSIASIPSSSGAMVWLTFSTALLTPLPRDRPLSPSRNSSASREPVDAPEGTAARPSAPLSSSTSTSTVGLPRESRISRACTSLISLMPSLHSCEKQTPRCRHAPLRHTRDGHTGSRRRHTGTPVRAAAPHTYRTDPSSSDEGFSCRHQSVHLLRRRRLDREAHHRLRVRNPDEEPASILQQQLHPVQLLYLDDRQARHVPR